MVVWLGLVELLAAPIAAVDSTTRTLDLVAPVILDKFYLAARTLSNDRTCHGILGFVDSSLCSRCLLTTLLLVPGFVAQPARSFFACGATKELVFRVETKALITMGADTKK